MLSAFLDLNLLLVFVLAFFPGHWNFSWDGSDELLPPIFCSHALL